MKNRYFLLGITGVLALSLAVPAFGGPSNPVASSAASAKTLAKRALGAANAAQNTANTALSTANSAKTDAKNAQTSADQAKVLATDAKTIAESKLGSPSTQNGDTSATNSTTPKQITSACPASSPKLLSGGYLFTGATINDLTTTINAPYGNAWITQVEEGDAIAGNWGVTALIQCAS